MNLIERFTRDLSTRRAQHLVYLLHLWLCVPFLFAWILDRRVKLILGEAVVYQLRLLVLAMIGYMVVRTWLAYVDPPKLKWWYLFPPIDVALVTLTLCLTHLGPMSNITLLFFLPMVQASGVLNVRWSAVVGLLVVLGTTLATFTAHDFPDTAIPHTIAQLLHDPLNVVFRLYFLLVISSLMAYQALIAAGYKERLGVAADRNRIAMEMHDGVQGHLITIASQLELIARVAEKDGGHAASIATEGREGARQAADELRFLVQRLRTPTMESGFVAALRQFSHNICDRNGLQLVFEQSGGDAAMAPDIENALFRIAQESLTNIVKHAKANSVTISLAFSDEMARLSLSDDGIGFDSSQDGSGIGLEGMRSRASMNGGQLLIECQHGVGTRVVATFTMKSSHG